MPFFSVLIPSYNRPELIGTAIRSVLYGNFPDFEVIISDDSSPRQKEIVASLQPFTRDPRVHLYLQSSNLGEAGNRDFLLHKATGEWQIILCDDDKLLPKALNSLFEEIRRHPGAEIYTFGYRLVDENDRCFYSRRAPAPLSISIADPLLAREVFASDSIPFWFFHPATFCAKRAVRERATPNTAVGIGDDMMFLMDFINSGGVIQVVPSVLMDYRKFSIRSAIPQRNQSEGDGPNLVSRALILQQLLGRVDLRPELAEFVTSKEFRRRFLFDVALESQFPVASLRSQFSDSPEVYAELMDYVAQGRPYFFRLRLQLRRVRFFLSTFGVGGLFEIFKVLFQRLLARFR